MSTVNLTQYAKIFTARLRSRAHNQAFAQTFQEKKKRHLSPTAKSAFKKVDEFESLARLYRRTYDPGLKSRAVNLLQVLPLPLSTEDDPHFVLATRVLRAAGMVGASHHPLTTALLQHCSKHSFLLDGYNLVRLLQVLRPLHHPQTLEVLRILLPRLQQVSEELTAGEAAEIIQILHDLELDKVCDLTTLWYAYAKQIEQTVGAGLSLADLAKCMTAVPLLPRPVAQRILVRASPSLCAHIRAERTLCSISAETAASSASSTSPHDAHEDTLQEAVEKETATEGDPPSTASSSMFPPLPEKPATSPSSTAPTHTNAEEVHVLLKQHVALHRATVEAFTYSGGTIAQFISAVQSPTASTSSSTNSVFLSTGANAAEVSTTLRAVWNELVRAVLDLSISYANAHHRSNRSSTPSPSSSSSSSSGPNESEPWMRREDVCRTIRMLHYCSYRHVPALQQLTSRYLTASPQPSEVKCVTPAESGLMGLQEMEMIVDAAGFFLVPLFTPVVGGAEAGVAVPHHETENISGVFEVLTMLLGEVSCGLFSRCCTGSPPTRLAALACLSQQWKNLTQLGLALQKEAEKSAAEEWTTTRTKEGLPPSPPPLLSSEEATAPARPFVSSPLLQRRVVRFAQQVRPAVEWSWYPPAAAAASPSLAVVVPLERYASSATCHQDPARTARLWHRLVALSTVLDPPPPPLPFPPSASSSEAGPVPTPPCSAAEEAVWPSASMEAMKTVQQALLAGLARHYAQRHRQVPPTTSASSAMKQASPSTSTTPSSTEALRQRMKVDQSVREDLSAAVRLLLHTKRRRCPETMAEADPTAPPRTSSSPSPLPGWMWSAAEEKSAMQWMEEHHLLEEEETEKK